MPPDLSLWGPQSEIPSPQYVDEEPWERELRQQLRKERNQRLEELLRQEEDDFKNELPKNSKLDLQGISKLRGTFEDRKKNIEDLFALEEEELINKERGIRMWSITDELEAGSHAAAELLNGILLEQEAILRNIYASNDNDVAKGNSEVDACHAALSPQDLREESDQNALTQSARFLDTVDATSGRSSQAELASLTPDRSESSVPSPIALEVAARNPPIPIGPLQSQSQTNDTRTSVVRKKQQRRRPLPTPPVSSLRNLSLNSSYSNIPIDNDYISAQTVQVPSSTPSSLTSADVCTRNATVARSEPSPGSLLTLQQVVGSSDPPNYLSDEGLVDHYPQTTTAAAILDSGRQYQQPEHDDAIVVGSFSDTPDNPQDPVATLKRLLSRLSDLNLSEKIDQKSLHLMRSTWHADVYTALLSLGSAEVKVAVKRLRINLQSDLEFAKRAGREIRIWSKLSHPNVLPLMGFTLEAEVIPSFVTRWMEHSTVLNFVQQHPAIDIYPLVEDIASGLNYLHCEKIVHADLKSDNIVVSPDHKPLIMDFGISHLLANTSTFESATRAEKGSARWMAIELFLGNGDNASEEDVHTMKSDVWAFGMTTLELLTKRRPYCHLRTDLQVMFAISTYQLPPTPTEAADWDGRHNYLWYVCQRCWARQPFERPSMEILLSILRGS